MSSTKLYSEIFEDFELAPTKNDKINVLRKHDHPRFRDFLVIAFNDNFKFDVIVPPYRPALEPAGLNYAYLDSEISKLYRFIANHPKRSTNLTPKRQTDLLCSVLETLHKDEAVLLCKLIKKDLDIPFLTVKLVKESFPGINI